LSPSAVDDAAVIVTEAPRAKLVPLMVPSDPEINPDPMVVVETSKPFSFVVRRAFATFVNQAELENVASVVDAFAND